MYMHDIPFPGTCFTCWALINYWNIIVKRRQKVLFIIIAYDIKKNLLYYNKTIEHENVEFYKETFKICRVFFRIRAWILLNYKVNIPLQKTSLPSHCVKIRRCYSILQAWRVRYKQITKIYSSQIKCFPLK
jgi:hypothetical protein